MGDERSCNGFWEIEWTYKGMIEMSYDDETMVNGLWLDEYMKTMKDMIWDGSWCLG